MGADMKLIFALLVLTASLGPATAQNTKTVKQLKKLIAALTPLVQQAQDLITQIQRTTTTPATAAIAANNVIVIADYYLTSGATKCGPQTVTGWTENVDYYRDATPAVSTTNTFTGTTGIFVPPVGGYYKICAFSRFRNTGNAVDMCIRKATTQVACYGNAIQAVATTDTISLYLESGGGSDCIEETGWAYNR